MLSTSSSGNNSTPIDAAPPAEMNGSQSHDPHLQSLGLGCHQTPDTAQTHQAEDLVTHLDTPAGDSFPAPSLTEHTAGTSWRAIAINAMVCSATALLLPAGAR